MNRSLLPRMDATTNEYVYKYSFHKIVNDRHVSRHFVIFSSTKIVSLTYKPTLSMRFINSLYCFTNFLPLLVTDTNPVELSRYIMYRCSNSIK
jgi:hypothetical protein